MLRTTTTRLIVATPLVALLAACGGEAGDTPEAPAGDAPPEIAERQDNFEAIGDSFKALREQLDTDAPDFLIIQASAADMNERLQRVPDLFPEGTSMEAGYDTEALAVIWEDPEGFAAASQKAVAASEEMIAAAESGDVEAVRGQVGNLGGQGCKGCHDKFRKPDD